MHYLFFWISYSIRNDFTIFENFSQPPQLVRETDQPIHYVIFSRTAVRALGIVWVNPHSFGVGIVHHLFFLFFTL